MHAELVLAGAALEARIAAISPPVSAGLLGCFPQQRAFIEDGSSFQVVFCTRRAAKSYSAGLKAFRKALQIPRCAVLIAGLARLEVKRIWWVPILKDIAERNGIFVKFNETELTATLANGSIIYLLGMDANEKEKRKALGQKFPLVIIDEAQDFVTDVNTLVFHVLKPAVADYRGSIVMLGTPGLIAKGLFYEATKPLGRDAMWRMHEWTTYDNTAPSSVDPKRTCAQEWADEIVELKRQKPGIENTPAFRRNYQREWVVDEDALVYRYLDWRNDFAELPIYPRGEWHYLLGVDLGYNDPTSFQVGAYHDHDPNLYLLRAEKEPGLDVTSVAIRAKALDRKYNFDAWLVDGSNKQAVEEMRKRHSCPWKPSDKRGKSDFIELMNAEYICGSIKLGPDCDPLREEYRSLIWDDTATKREEHSACENHCADGALYLWRYAYTYLSERLRPPPSAEEAQVQEEEDIERQLEERVRKDLQEALQ